MRESEAQQQARLRKGYRVEVRREAHLISLSSHIYIKCIQAWLGPVQLESAAAWR
jgi:hypothetical protein